MADTTVDVTFAAVDEDEIHLDACCDGCGAQPPLFGRVMKCQDCADFDLCGTCYKMRAELGHPADHCFGRREGSHRGIFFKFLSLLESATEAIITELECPICIDGAAAAPSTGGCQLPWPSLTSARLTDLVICAPLRYPWPAGVCAVLGLALNAVAVAENPMAMFSSVVLCKVSLCLAGCWLGALCSALWLAIRDEDCSWSNAGDHFWTRLLPSEPMILNTDQLRYSRPTVALASNDALFVYEARSIYYACAFFYQGRLFTTDNDVLYAARFNSVEQLEVSILPPFGFVPEAVADKTQGNRVSIFFPYAHAAVGAALRDALKIVDLFKKLMAGVPLEDHRKCICALYGMPFLRAEATLRHAYVVLAGLGLVGSVEEQLEVETALERLSDYRSLRSYVRFVMTVIDEKTPKPAEGERQACSLALPADAFPTDSPRPMGHVVLEVDQIINARAGRNETLCNLIAGKCPRMEVSQPEGVRHYARVKVQIADETIVRAVIKQIARERGKRTNIKVVERAFYSPRD